MNNHACPSQIILLTGILFIFMVAPTYSQKVGGSFGYHLTKWDIFDHCYDFTIYGEIPLLKTNFFLIPTGSIRLLTGDKITGDSVQSTHEKAANILSVFCFGAGYKVLSLPHLSIKPALQLGILPFLNETSIFNPDSTILPAEVRFTANLLLDIDITLSSHFGIDFFPILGYVSESTLQSYKTRLRGHRPFDSYIMFKGEVGMYFRFGSFH